MQSLIEFHPSNIGLHFEPPNATPRGNLSARDWLCLASGRTITSQLPSKCWVCECLPLLPTELVGQVALELACEKTKAWSSGVRKVSPSHLPDSSAICTRAQIRKARPPRGRLSHQHFQLLFAEPPHARTGRQSHLRMDYFALGMGSVGELDFTQ
jgi:hypothetical protein